MKPIYALDKLFTHKLFLNKYFLYAVSAISAFVNLQHVMYHEFEYVALFIFIVLVAKGFSKNWSIVLMVGIGLSQMFNLSVKTYEGFTQSGNTLQNKINRIKQRIANKREKLNKHKQRIASMDAKIQQNEVSIDKYRTERDKLEQSVMNVKDPVAKAHAINSTDQQKQKTELTNKIKEFKKENEQLRTNKALENTQVNNTNTQLRELNTELKKKENEFAVQNAREKAKADAKRKAGAKANADVKQKAHAKARADAKAKQQAELNKLLGKKVKTVGPGPAKATAKFSLMQEDDSDQSDDEEMEPKLQSKRPDDFDYLDPSKISGLTQGATNLLSSQKELFTFMNSITPFIENAKKMLKDVDINKLPSGSK
jgi:chromosome segregation ATPase